MCYPKNVFFSIILSWSLLSGYSACGQAITTFEGTVTEKTTGLPIPYAAVTCYRGDSLLTGSITDTTGKFSISTNQRVTHLVVRFIGYEPVEVSTQSIEDYSRISINMMHSQEVMQELIVDGERSVTELKIDRKVFNLGADLQQSGTTALEALDQIPEITVDPGGGVSLRGNEQVRLLINGKPTALSPLEVLEQIPAAAISKIELISSPSARNQSDGLSGVLNVVLARQNQPGANLSLNAGIGTKRHTYGMDGNYHFSNLNIGGSFSHAVRDMDSKQQISQRFLNGSTRDLYAPHDLNGRVTKGALEIDWHADPKNVLSLRTDYTFDYHDFFNDTYYSNVSDRDDFRYTRNSSHTHKTLSTNLNFRRSIAGESHFLEFDYNLTQNNNIMPAADFEEGIPLFTERRSNVNYLHALSVDYLRPLGEKHHLETGLAWNGRVLTSFNFRDQLSESPVNEQFDYNEHIVGVYAMLRGKTAKLQWQTGMRYEHAVSQSSNSANDLHTDLRFQNLFPSVHLTYALNATNTVNAGYSRRVSRPNFSHVNPFRMGNQYFQWIANPSLSPEFSNNLEVNYQHNGKAFTYSAIVFGHFRRDAIIGLNSVNEAGVQTISFDNIGGKSSTGIEVEISRQHLKYWTSQLSANHYFTAVHNNVFVTWDRLYSSGFIFKNTFSIHKNLTVDLTYRYSFKDQRSFNIREPRNRLDWAMRARLLKNKLTASFRIIDVFNKNLMHRKTITNSVIQREVWRFQSQTFGVLFSLKYKIFQSDEKKRKRQNKNYEHNGSVE